MNYRIIIPVAASLMLLFHSCAFHHGTFSSGNMLPEARFAGIVKGKSTTFHFLGIGGLSKSALVNEARMNVYKKYPLRNDMFLNNISVDKKQAFYFIAMHTTCTFTAELYETQPIQVPKPFQGRINGFFTSDTIFYLLNKPASCVNYPESDTLYIVTDQLKKAIFLKSNTVYGSLYYLLPDSIKVYIDPEWIVTPQP